MKYSSNPTTTPRSPEKSCNEVDGHDEAPAGETRCKRELATNNKPTTRGEIHQADIDSDKPVIYIVTAKTLKHQ